MTGQSIYSVESETVEGQEVSLFDRDKAVFVLFLWDVQDKMSVYKDKTFVLHRRKLWWREVESCQPSSVEFHSFGQSGLLWVITGELNMHPGSEDLFGGD